MHGGSGASGGADLGGVIFMTKPTTLVAVWQEVPPPPATSVGLYVGVVALVAAAGLAAFFVQRRRHEAARLREAWSARDEWEEEPPEQS